ncbi:hypothetical protein [uncultured Chryseobacterium sp.]|uniref:hypothetical protein n=1 Tax=Chryseobacterium sp. sg2396 TaxID=3276280 RepID=UPI0025842688|nr:hypothetical protein [uncultured Chryseobacterium sp.]
MKTTITLLAGIFLLMMNSCNNSNETKIKNNQVMQSTEEQKKGILHGIDLYVEGGRKGDQNG